MKEAKQKKRRLHQQLRHLRHSGRRHRRPRHRRRSRRRQRRRLHRRHRHLGDVGMKWAKVFVARIGFMVWQPKSNNSFKSLPHFFFSISRKFSFLFHRERETTFFLLLKSDQSRNWLCRLHCRYSSARPSDVSYIKGIFTLQK